MSGEKMAERMKDYEIIGFVSVGVIAFLFALFLNAWSEDIIFYLTNRNPSVSEITSQKIDLQKEPLQKDLADFQKMKKYYTHQKTFFIEPKAEYEISGRILSTNMKLGMWGVSRTDFDYVALIDVVLGWQDVANIELYEDNVKGLHQAKSPNGGRYYRFYVPGDSIWSVDYVSSHTSHNHIVPASNNIMAVLWKLKKYDVVKLKGYLVDIYKDGNTVAWTSLSRYDTDQTSRGYQNGKFGGSCEVMYVTSIQIEDKIYR